MTPSPSIFLSYRRDDTAPIGILQMLLQEELSATVFVDRNMQAGQDFPLEISRNIQNADVVLLVVGERWLRRDSDGASSLMSQTDWVRREIEEARELGKPIVPVLVDAGHWPTSEDQLPKTLHFLLGRHYTTFSTKAAPRVEIRRLAAAIRTQLEKPTPVPVLREPTAEDFVNYVTELSPYAQALQEEQVRRGFVDGLYSVTYEAIRDLSLPKGRVTLIEGRRGTGKTFLLTRLAAEARDRGSDSTATVLHIWKDTPDPAIDPAELPSQLATLLIWGVVSEWPNIHPADSFDGNWELFQDLAKAYKSSNVNTLADAETALLKVVEPGERRRVSRFLLAMSSVEYQWSELRALLTNHGIRHLNLFVDEFTESVPYAHVHDQFMRMLKHLRAHLAPTVSCTIVASIYPRVTSLREFRDGEDGRIIRLEYDGTWSQWHTKATDFLGSQFRAYCENHGLQVPSARRTNELRNKMFHGKAIKRLSYISNRNPRQYLHLLQDAVAGHGSDRIVSIPHLDAVAGRRAPQDVGEIARTCSKFDELSVSADEARQVFHKITGWVRHAVSARPSQERASLSLRLDSETHETALPALHLLDFMGLIRSRESPSHVEVELSPLHALDHIIKDPDMERLGRPFELTGSLLEEPGSTIQPTSRGTLYLSELEGRVLSKLANPDEVSQLQRSHLHKMTVGQLAVFSRSRNEFVARKRTVSPRSVEISPRLKNLIVGILTRHIDEQEVEVYDDTTVPSAETLLSQRLSNLGLAKKVVDKLEAAKIRVVRDLVGHFSDRGVYGYNGGPRLEGTRLTSRERRRVSAAVSDYLESYNLKFQLNRPTRT